MSNFCPGVKDAGDGCTQELPANGKAKAELSSLRLREVKDACLLA